MQINKLKQKDFLNICGTFIFLYHARSEMKTKTEIA